MRLPVLLIACAVFTSGCAGAGTSGFARDSAPRAEAMSLLGTPLFAPHIADESRLVMEQQLAAAREQYNRNPNDADAIIWLGRRLAYLDSAATSLKPRAVADAMSAYLNTYSANVHRGIYEIGEEATAAYEGARAKIAAFLGASDPREIVMVRNATEAINLVAYAWGRKNIKQADTIVTTEMEHHSNLIPWQMLAQEKDADLEFVPFDDDGRLLQDSYEVLLRTNPKLVAFTAVSNGIGTINPVAEMVRKAHDAGALVLIDGAQAGAHIPIDVQDLDCDFYCLSSHKMYGPTGTGILYGKKRLLEMMPPYQGGGEMISEVRFEKTTYNALPYKFEAGTPNIADVIAFRHAMEFILDLGRENIAAHEQELLEYATAKLGRLESVTPVGTAAHKVGVLAFTVKGIHHFDVGQMLDAEQPDLVALCLPNEGHFFNAGTLSKRLVPAGPDHAQVAALAAGADSILLDNMPPAGLAEAVRLIAGRALAEASGGVSLETVRAVAESGVDLISIGALTHSAPALDVALDFDWSAPGAPAHGA